VQSTGDVILFSPLPVDACRRRVEDAILVPHASLIAGRVRSHGIEIWRRQSSFRFFQPTLVLRLCAADERTRLETRMSVEASAFYGMLAYVVVVATSALVSAMGWLPIGLLAVVVESAIIFGLRHHGGRALPADGLFLRDQLGVLVHASEPVR
jgi:hypothetical protein